MSVVFKSTFQIIEVLFHSESYSQLRPNTHRRRDATVVLNRVEVLTRPAVCTEFATSSRRLSTDLVENLETEHVENLSCRVELCRRCVRTQPWATAAEFKLGHDCWLVHSHRRRDSTRQLRRVGVGGVLRHVKFDVLTNCYKIGLHRFIQFVTLVTSVTYRLVEI